ncbi:MAG: acetoacetate--CoA ligase [Chloroflexi bacterium]|nr:acetoacetate--CoA ligase [Chloroflexota bacterium]MCI0578154.1 acetoacetate--CoA ligase [Chloroflexota bacterium]MCI0645587.1 acetoacetate--CoA ligase [Chloroflexota bacterium]MCI0730890.1 acetoacetate--CoA ligase [Chloroflexota bacterium]
MNEVTEGSLLWAPPAAVKENANLTHYMAWLAGHYGLAFDSYRALWQWSVSDVAQFWQSIWEYFAVKASRQPSEIVADKTMPGARWFVGARLNYAENIFEKMTAFQPAVFYQAEEGPLLEIGRQELYEKTSALAQALRAMGVQRGDRVVAYLPNVPEAMIGLLATASLGAIWSSCSPDFGSRSVLDRFSQIEPKVLLAADGYRYNGQPFDRLKVLRELQGALPTLERTILVPLLGQGAAAGLPNTVAWDEALAGGDVSIPLSFEQVPFDHPLWVLYSSGTTGLPKPIVHGHGGIILEHVKETSLHMDLKPQDRFFWYTSTGWMMWNYLVGGLLAGGSIVMVNGSPGYPDMNVLWKLAAEAGVTYFGTSAAFIHACMKAEIKPSEQFDLSRIRALGSTGSPLSPAGFQWVYENVNRDLALESFSGGTDLCTGFIGGIRIQPVYAGELQGASLGASVQAFDETGRPVIDEVGELVITEPMPSMPLYFWNDPDNRRYRESYFEMYPGVWRHGDWIKINERGGCVIYGRSDSTINRHGVRMGTSEIYQAVESIPEIADSLVIDLEALGGESHMLLFVVPQEGVAFDDVLAQQIRWKIREDISPRHVPDEIIAVDQVPYTLSGKKMEVPVRKILLGQPVDKAANPGAMRNPAAIQFFADFAAARQKH